MTQVIRIGSIAHDVYSDIIYLFGTVGDLNYKTLTIEDGTFYQVPAGYNIIISRIEYLGDKSGDQLIFGYGDDVADDVAVAPTNPVIVTPEIHIINADEFLSKDFYITIPSLKYFFIHSLTGVCRCMAYGLLKGIS